MKRILVVEDEPAIAFGLQADLVAEGYDVAVVGDGETAARRAREGIFDLILLDVMLPRKDGFEVCRELRRAGIKTPILLLTARSQEVEKVMGLEWGADDYVTKPFSPPELRARIKALLRRASGGEEAAYRFGDVEVDFARCELRRGGRTIEMTAPRAQAARRLHPKPRRGSSAARSCSTRPGGPGPSSRTGWWTTTSWSSGRRSKPSPTTRATWSACAAWGTASTGECHEILTRARTRRRTVGTQRDRREGKKKMSGPLRWRIGLCLVPRRGLVLAALASAQKEETPQLLLEKATKLELVDGDLKGAIAIDERILGLPGRAPRGDGEGAPAPRRVPREAGACRGAQGLRAPRARVRRPGRGSRAGAGTAGGAGRARSCHEGAAGLGRALTTISSGSDAGRPLSDPPGLGLRGPGGPRSHHGPEATADAQGIRGFEFA